MVVRGDFTETFTVQPYEKTSRSIQLNSGDTFKGHVSVVAGFKDPSLTDFLPCVLIYLTGSDGSVVSDLFDQDGFLIAPDQEISRDPREFNFTASTTGTYTVHFDNRFNVTRRVEFYYRVTETVAGIPMESLSLILPVVLVVGVAVVLVVLLNPKRKKQVIPTPTPSTTTPLTT